jgi:plasmid stabilization system protein ParE
MRLWFDPAGRAEYVGVAAHYKALGSSRGRAFAEDFRAALDAILAFPRSSSADDDGVRQKVLRKHPYIIVYRASDEDIEIVALAHTTREPGYWRNRL